MLGISVPVRLDASGSTATESGGDQLDKVIRLSLCDCKNDNPFQQDIGLPVKIFQIPGTSPLDSYIREVFAKLEAERRARLETYEIASVKDGEVEVKIKYIDIENNQTRELVL